MPDIDPLTVDDDTIIHHPMFPRELELEMEMRERGVERFEKNVAYAKRQHRESELPHASRLVNKAYIDMVAVCREWMESVRTAKKGKHGNILPWLEVIGPEKASLITVQCVLDRVSDPAPIVSMALKVGGALENEVEAQKYRENDPASFNQIVPLITGDKGSPDKSYRALLKHAEKRGLEVQRWTKKLRTEIGGFLVNMMVEATGLFEMRLISRGGPSRSRYVLPTDALLKWLDEEGSRMAALSPVWLPTVVPPRPWTDPFNGGYWSPPKRVPMVRGKSQKYLRDLAECDMPMVYDSLNALQATAWQINPDVLSVMEEAWQQEASIKGIPLVKDQEIPEAPLECVNTPKEDWDETQMTAFKMWKRRARALHEQNRRDRGTRVAFILTIQTAREFADYPEIFFPHSLDWRGRAYPIPSYVSPQGPDNERSLLRFAASVPICDEEDEMWLAVHGAGCWGVDKVSLEERHQWIKDRSQLIRRVVEDPLGDGDFWQEAEKPWQALAFCFEWVRYQDEGFGYESQLPVQMDGTCNGLQNYSAMLLDEIGGEATNLIPMAAPQDIYQRVADVVNEQVNIDAAKGDKYALAWQGNITRKVVKRPVMTLPYGAKRYGFVQMIQDDTISPWKATKPDTYPFTLTEEEGEHAGKVYDFGLKAAEYLGGILWDRIGDVVVAAIEAMQWLQTTARMVVKEHKDFLWWMTPNGFYVQQRYSKKQTELVTFAFRSKEMRISLKEDTETPHAKQQADGISPNWVHSLDAAHLQRTICAAREAGIRSFAMIHDSYGTHAGNAFALANILRLEFAEMYSQHDVLEEFRQALCERYPDLAEDLPPVPKKGNLDLGMVIHSPYFFA